MSAATQIAATSRQQESLVHEYGGSTNEAAAAVKEISATGQELLRTMTEVNQLAGETASLAAHGQESPPPPLSGMDRTMRLLADSTASIGSKLSVISERAANINLVVTTITKVADQTNLLSINAAIEAEKLSPASTASGSSSWPGRSAASPTRRRSRPWTSSGWSRRCSTASRPA